MNKFKALAFSLFIILLYFAASVITGLFFAFYLSIIRKTDLHTIEQLLFQNTAVIAAVAAVIALFFIWLFFLITGKSILKYCRFEKTSPRNLLLALLMGTGMALFFISLLTLLELDRFFPEHQALMRFLLHESGFIISLLLIGILIPFIEEVVYRGIILNRLRRDFSLTAALLLQAFFFGLIHLNLLQSSYAFLGSIPIGLSYFWAGTIWVPILIHIGWNSTSVLLSTFLETTPSTAVYIAMLITGLIFIVTCLRSFKRDA